MRLCNTKSGFTLIEMMIVIAIMAVFAGIATPNFLSYMPKYRLNGAARQVMGDLMAARMNAVSQNNEFRIFFLANGHEYMILDDDNNNGTADTGEWTETKDIQNEYHDVTIGSNNDPIFSPRGTATNWPTITLTNPSGSKTITISRAGGVSIS
jgi:type IV fimbrial biogenesis protein FimT